MDDRIVFPSAEKVNEHTTRIPFKIVDQLIIVKATVLDKTGNFIIDTGSETLILNKAHFKHSHAIYDKKNQPTGVHDVIDGYGERKLDEFKIQEFTLNNTISDVIDLSHIEGVKKINLLGIIGFNVLKEHEVFIDMHLNQITLSKLDSLGERLDKDIYLETIVDSIAFKLNKHAIIVDAIIEGNELKFALDSGSEFNQINKRISKKVLKYFYPDRRIQLSGASGRKIEVLSGKLYRLKLTNKTYFGPMKTILTNLSQLNEVFGSNIDGVLGFEFFKQKRPIINYKKKRLFFIDFPLIRQ